MRKIFKTKCILMFLVTIHVFYPANIMQLWTIVTRYRCPHRNTFHDSKVISQALQDFTTSDAKYKLPEDDDSCEVRSMGCFQSLPKLFVPDVVSIRLTPNRCFNFCNEIGMLYASLYNGQTCYCGENFLGVALLTMSQDCKIKCSGDGFKYCGGKQSSQVYMITNCNKVMKNEILEGCLVRTKNDLFNQEEPLDKDDCIKICGKAGFTVAVPAKKCVCGYRQNVKTNSKGQACVRGTPYRTLAPDSKCDNKTLLPAGTNPPIALASFPGSGNTWFRQMIETATGVYTGSVYDEELIFAHGFIGERLPADSGKTVVIKDHVLHSLDAFKYKSAILLIRDPYDAILAEYNRFRTLGHVASVSDEMLKSRDFHLFVNRKATTWKNTYSKIIRRVPRLLPVYFEDSVKDAVTQIRRILDFLPESSFIHGPDLETRLQCLEVDVHSKFKRPKRSLIFDPFSQDLKRKINDNIRGLRQELERVNISTMPKYERQGVEKKFGGKSSDRGQRNRQLQKIRINAKDKNGA
ncbi:sialate:O-sulfotransferase 2-like [Styela clava]